MAGPFFSELEIELDQPKQGEYTLSFRFALAGADGIRRLPPCSTGIDLVILREKRGGFDMPGYGKLLTEQLLTTEAARSFFNECLEIAFNSGYPLRLQMLIWPAAEALQEIVWEALQDPRNGALLSTSDLVWFSRHLLTKDRRSPGVKPLGELSALVMAADPKDGPERGLAAVDVKGEIERVRAVMGDIPIETLPKEESRATLANLMKATREGADILYLICHGVLKRGAPFLMLENDQGTIAQVNGAELVSSLADLEQPPRLVVLAACESAGVDRAGVLAAIGPQLAMAGVPAVLAMQGKVSMITVSAFMPVFFTELMKDGQIDRALSVARSAVKSNADAWMPVLYLGSKSGKLWEQGFTGECPYIGLRTYEEGDADRFFGREQMVRSLLERLKESRALFITGPSGSGKSSVVRAGLIPALKKEGKPGGGGRWLVGTLRPGRSPLNALESAVARMVGSLSAGSDLHKLAADDADALYKTIEFYLPEDPNLRAVLFVDQFEELFAPQLDEGERQIFLKLLTHAILVEGGRTVVLITMRSDFITNCASYPELNDLLNKHFFQVGAMRPDELEQAITLPAERVGLPVEAGLVAQIIEDMGEEPGALPLMQFALKDLFDARQQSKSAMQLTRADYLERGGIRKALERHANSEFNHLSPKEQRVAEAIFLGLVETASGGPDTRRTVYFAELASGAEDPTGVEAVVSKLADARLITTGEEDDQRTVMIAHEKLIDAWPWLKKLLNENRDVISLKNEITIDAKEWAGHQRNPSYLYSGARLANASTRLAQKKLQLSGLPWEFFQASRIRQRRGQIMAVAGAVVLFALLLLAVIIFRQQSGANAVLAEQNGKIALEAQQANTVSVAERQKADVASTLAVAQQLTAQAASTQAVQQQRAAEDQAKIARSGELAVIAIDQLNIDQDRSLLIALEANRAAHTLEANDALRQAVRVVKLQSVLAYCPSAADPGNREKILDVSYQFSDDLSLVAIYCANPPKKIRILHNDTGKVLSEIPVADGFVYGFDFSGDDTKFAYIYRGPGGGIMAGIPQVWDLDQQKELFSSEVRFVNEHPKIVSYVQLSQDGSRLWGFDPDGGQVDVYDVRTQHIILSLSSVDIGRRMNGNQIAISTLVDGRYRIVDRYDMSTLTKKSFKVKDTESVVSINSTIITSDGWLAAADSGFLRFYHFETGDELARVSLLSFSGSSLALSPDHSRLAYIDGKQITLRDVKGDSGVQVLAGHQSDIGAIGFSKDSRLLVSTSLDTTCRIWDAQAGTLKTTINKVFDCVFGPDGARLLLHNEDNSVSIWEPGNVGEIASIYVGQPVLGAFFSIDGPSIQIITGSNLYVWDWRQPSAALTPSEWDKRIFRVYNWRPPDLAQDVRMGYRPAFEKTDRLSPDGRFKVSLDSGNELRVIDTQTGQTLGKTYVSTDQVNDLEFSPDSTRLILSFGSPYVSLFADLGWQPSFTTIGDLDHTAGVWDLTTLQKTAVLRGFTNAVTSASFSPDSKYIVTASLDGIVRIYLANSADLEDLAQQRIVRNPPELTCTERVQFLKENLVCPTAIPASSRSGNVP